MDIIGYQKLKKQFSELLERSKIMELDEYIQYLEINEPDDNVKNTISYPPLPDSIILDSKPFELKVLIINEIQLYRKKTNKIIESIILDKNHRKNIANNCYNHNIVIDHITYIINKNNINILNDFYYELTNAFVYFNNKDNDDDNKLAITLYPYIIYLYIINYNIHNVNTIIKWCTVKYRY